MRLAPILALTALLATTADAQPRDPRSRHLESQDPADASMINWDEDASKSEVRKVLHKFARCSVKGSQSLSRRLVLGDTDFMKDARKRKYFSASCLSDVGGLRMGPTVIRGAVAEVMVRRDFSDTDSANFEGVEYINPYIEQVASDDIEIVDIELTEEAAADLKHRARQSSLRGDLGECLVRSATQKSEALLATDVASREEVAAVNAMVPEMRDCLYADTQYTLDLGSIRGMVATSYYRLAWAKQEASK